MNRNTPGQYFYAILLTRNGPLAGEAANCSCRVSIDNAAEKNLDGNPAAEDFGNGLYGWPLSQSDTDGHELRFEPTHPNPTYSFVGQPSLVIYTREQGVNLTQVNGFDVTATGEVDFELLNRLKIISAVLSNKVVTEDAGDGKRRLRFRNITDTADELVVDYDPQTGDREVI